MGETHQSNGDTQLILIVLINFDPVRSLNIDPYLWAQKRSWRYTMGSGNKTKDLLMRLNQEPS